MNNDIKKIIFADKLTDFIKEYDNFPNAALCRIATDGGEVEYTSYVEIGKSYHAEEDICYHTKDIAEFLEFFMGGNGELEVLDLFEFD